MAKPKFEIVGQESGIDLLPSETREPVTLQARIARIEQDAVAIAQESADARPGLQSLDHYPSIIVEMRRQILVLSEMAETLLHPYEVQLMALKLQIADAIDEKGKPIFSNEEKRRAEYEHCAANLAGYAEAKLEQRAILGAVARLDAELRFLQDQFGAAKLMAQLEAARLQNDIASISQKGGS